MPNRLFFFFFQLLFPFGDQIPQYSSELSPLKALVQTFGETASVRLLLLHSSFSLLLEQTRPGGRMRDAGTATLLLVV